MVDTTTTLLFVAEAIITLPPTCKLPTIPVPPATYNAPDEVDVAAELDVVCSNPAKVPVVPTFNAPPMPAPPRSTSAPVVVDVDVVFALATRLPVVVPDPIVAPCVKYAATLVLLYVLVPKLLFAQV